MTTAFDNKQVGMAKDEDSSSSEDFEAKLREAVDPTLFTNSMFAADVKDAKKAQPRGILSSDWLSDWINKRLTFSPR